MFEILEQLDEAEKVALIERVSRDEVGVAEAKREKVEELVPRVSEDDTVGLLELLTLRESETSSLRLALFESVPDTCSLRELGSEFERVITSERE